MSTRNWNLPDVRNGTTINHISDTHFGAAGNADWLNGWLNRAQEDIVSLKDSCHGYVHTGDCIHWDQPGDQPTEDGWFIKWYQGIATLTQKPIAIAPGNHDEDSFAASDPSANRTGDQWAKDIQYAESKNTMTKIGGLWICAVGPDALPPGQGWLFSEKTLQFIDESLTAAGSDPVFIAFHCPPSGQYSGTTPGIWHTDYRNPTLFPIMDSHTNCVGMLHGHAHANIDVINHARTLSIGSREIFSINGPPCGGGRYGNVAYADHRWQSPMQSLYLTYLGDAVVARWRDHLRRIWTTSAGVLSRTISLSGGGGSSIFDIRASTPTLMATVDWDNENNMQCTAVDPVTGHFYSTQAVTTPYNGYESVRIYHSDPSGAPIDSMELLGGGHGHTINVRHEADDSVTIWGMTWDEPGGPNNLGDRLVSFKYTPNTPGAGVNQSQVPGGLTELFFGSGTGRYVTASADWKAGQVSLRCGAGSTETYELRNIADVQSGVNNVLKLIGPFDNTTQQYQGHCSYQNFLYRYSGSGVDPATHKIDRWDWTTQQLTTIPTAILGQNPDGTYPDGICEPEGMSTYLDSRGNTSILAGVSMGNADPDHRIRQVWQYA
jgi:hypothetical protein